MYQVFTVLIVILAVILVLIVLVQNAKGGGLASNFSSANQAIGVRKTTSFLEKTTWVLIAAIVVFSVAAAACHTTHTQQVTGIDTTQAETEMPTEVSFDETAAEAEAE